jgi:glutathione peroxidase
MLLIKLLISIILINPSIYSLSIINTEGASIPLEIGRNKVVLMVNIATGSDRVAQLGELQQLQQRFGDSLMLIGFPSNSFGNENRRNAEIKQFCLSNYGVSILMAAKASVIGPDIQPTYKWLTNQTENGILQSNVKGDFQKYLIDKYGNLVGVFAGKLTPLDIQVTSAIAKLLN